MTDYFKNRYIEFIKKFSERYKRKTTLNKSELGHFFEALIDIHELPSPPNEIKKYFLHPNILADLFRDIFNSKYLSRDDRINLNPSFNEIFKVLKKKRSDFNIQFRILNPGGTYPNIELKRGSSKYSINNHIPILITKNKNYKDIFADESIINWLTKNELKFTTAMMCAPKSGIFHFDFASYNSFNIDYDCIVNIPKNLQFHFLRELFDINRLNTPVGVKQLDRKPLSDIKEYEYFSFKNSVKHFNKLFDNYSISNDLLLRTSNYFVKAIMHWDNQIFAEEAITNTLFCLEGCLHLIQKKFGDTSPKLNLSLLKKIFRDRIPYGENLFNYIEEGYETRISLVHAEPEWGADWDPMVTVDEFYEYFELCRSLLNFILIDRHLDIH